MKLNMFKLFAVALVLTMLFSFLPAQPARAATTIIAQWTFESPNTPATATAAVYPNAIAPAVGSGNAGGVHTSASTAWSTPVGNGSAYSFSSNYWSVGNYYQFRTSTAGFTGILVSWDQTGSATGPRDFKLAYSTDGVNFTDFYSYSLPSPAISWSSGSTSLATKFSSDLSSVTALDNQATVYFRLIDAGTVSINGGTVGTSGTGRVDNFTVRGTGDQAPYVASTVPANGATDVPLNSNITINFSEAVNVPGSWFLLSCATSGVHAATVTGGPTTFTLDPGADFVGGESCTLTVYAAYVNDQDLIDPPDNMTVNFTAGYTTVTPPIPIGKVNGPVPDSDSCATHTSPYVGQTVKIQGVIYEKTLQAISNSTDTYKGFYIQNNADTADTDPTTSDGLFVFMSTASTLGGYTPQVGDEIILTGKVQEYYNMTELVSPLTVVQVVRSGVVIDDEIPSVVANPPVSLADANCYWERLQGMRVQVPQNSIVLGGRNVFSPADAEIWLARSDSTIAMRTNEYARKAFRDAHILDDNYDPTNWDGNGYRIPMGSLGIKATAGDAQALIDPARAYSTVTNAPAGGLNYTFSKYRIEISEQPTFSEGVDPAANNSPATFDHSINYTIVDYNLENLYDYRDNPFSGCDFNFTGNSGCPKVAPYLSAVTPPYDYVPASNAAYQARLNDIALQIINDLHSPDILMVQEVENQDICTMTGSTLTCGTTDNADGKPDVLQELALKIASLGGPAYDAAFDRNSSDLRGIAPAFLYRTDRVQLLSPIGDPILGSSPVIDGYTAVPYDSDVSNPKTLNAVLPAGVTACETSWVFPRAPDIGLFRIYSTSIGVGSHRDVYVINNHFKSGPDTCIAHRTEQAKYNAAIVAFLQAANPDARIVVGGDLNVYPRPDDIGYGASDQLGSLYDPSLGLTNLWDVLLGQAPESAYSYVYLGMAQTLDQMFINPPMLADLKQYRIAHINSDFPADYPYDVARGTSDHDPNVAAFVINDPPTADAGGPYTVDEGSSIMLTATGSDPEGQTPAYAWDLDNNGTYETPGQSVSFTGVDGPATLTVNVQVTDNGNLTAVASATVTVNNVAPTIVSVTNNDPINEGSSATITVNATDPAGANDPLTYEFDCNNDSTFETTTGFCAFADNGTYTVNVRVSDGDGGIATGSTVVIVNNVAPTVDTPVVSPEPSTEGSSVVANATFSDPGVNDAPFTCMVDYGDGSSNLPGTISSNTCTGPAHVYPTFGAYIVTVNVTDKDGGTGSNSTIHIVIFNWTGFFNPVDNLPAWNSAKAGSAIPVKFSLGGNKGLNIFATGYPQSVQIACDTGVVLGSLEPTANPGGSSMSYGDGQYNYVWKTDKAWAGTCRQLIVMLTDGTEHYAFIKFK
jgi:predicted extracellular nuclease